MDTTLEEAQRGLAQLQVEMHMAAIARTMKGKPHPAAGKLFRFHKGGRPYRVFPDGSLRRVKESAHAQN